MRLSDGSVRRKWMHELPATEAPPTLKLSRRSLTLAAYCLSADWTCFSASAVRAATFFRRGMSWSTAPSRAEMKGDGSKAGESQGTREVRSWVRSASVPLVDPLQGSSRAHHRHPAWIVL